LIIFSATLPHGPNLNSTGAVRIAAYGSEMCNERSYLPNGVDSIQNSVENGASPYYSAHAAGNYILSLISRHFFPRLPHRKLNRLLLADCLFGFKSWKEFEDSIMAKYLFGPSPELNILLDIMHEHMTLDLRSLNDEMERLVTIHEDHPFDEHPDCTVCKRMASATF
jgi:hypothetical protein